jgi:hypothetical protein
VVSQERNEILEDVEITDVAIIEGDRVPDDDRTEPGGCPPVVLAPGLTLEVLPYEQSEAYLDAAESRGANFKAYRQFAQRYAFVRRQAPGPLFHWDPDSLIQHALAMSRLIRDNNHDARYSVRVIEGPGVPGDGKQIAPGPAWDAWFTPNEERKWLSQQEAEMLAVLLQQRLAIDTFSTRVGNALWFAEYSTRTPYAVAACIWIVATLEALLNTDQYRLRRQFNERCLGLASELSLDAVTSEVTNRMYTARSESVHGSLGGEGHEQLLADLASMQLLARKALRRCIEDAAFRAIFDRREAVAAKWPVSTS